jgi:hypothetical protein
MKLILCVVEFAVADIRDIEWSPSLFDHLTIPDEDKEIIIALAESRTGRVPGCTFDDFVTGKGRGLNVLLKYVLLCDITSPCLTDTIVDHQGLERL